VSDGWWQGEGEEKKVEGRRRHTHLVNELLGDGISPLQGEGALVDGLLDIADIVGDFVNVSVLLADGGNDVHDAVRVQGAVDILRQLVELLGKSLGPRLLVLEVLNHACHFLSPRLHLVDHLAALVAPLHLARLDAAQLVHEWPAVRLPLLRELHEALGAAAANCLQLADVLGCRGEHLERFTLDHYLLLEGLALVEQSGELAVELADFGRGVALLPLEGVEVTLRDLSGVAQILQLLLPLALLGFEPLPAYLRILGRQPGQRGVEGSSKTTTAANAAASLFSKSGCVREATPALSTR